ncbi:MAG: hypothetical protein EA366_02425 [Spirulina sp. DLM2.Bin59]|nr:MAG: hypothetical protein EA366_02425 [Spirulina sp. DLM2.Bin59]
MSKLAGHLLQTAPFVLAASLIGPQGASAAPPAAVDQFETTETATIETTNWQAPAPPEPNPELDLREPPIPVAMPVDLEPVVAPEPVAMPVDLEPVVAPEPVAVVESESEPMVLPPVAGDPLTVAEPVILPEAAAPLEITTPTATPTVNQTAIQTEIVGDALTETAVSPWVEMSEERSPIAAESPTALDLTPEIAGDPLLNPEPEAKPILLKPVAQTPPAPPTPKLLVSPMALDELTLEGPRGATPAPMVANGDNRPGFGNPDLAAPFPAMGEQLDELETGAGAIAQTNVHDLLDQINQYTNENNFNQGQGVGSASQFRDVLPTDWAYTALDDLVRRYDCIRGYPDGTFRGNRALTRYEFAAGLNACIQQIERIIAETTADLASRADLEMLQRLVQEFEGELATIGTRVDAMDGRVAFLEEHQFSTTTKLNGEVLFAINALLPQSYTPGTTNVPVDSNVVFQDRVRLNLDTSFTGRDRLRTRLQANNVSNWPGIDGLNGITYETRYGFAGDNGNNFELSTLSYQFPLGNQLTAQVFANGAGMDDFLPPMNPLNSSGGSISRFGQYNPILRVGGQRQGLGASYQVSDRFQVAVGYTAGEGQDPLQGGMFNGSYALGGQIKYQTNTLGIAFQYVNSYNTFGGLGHSTGSIASNLNTGASVTGHSFGAEVLFRPSDNLFVGGWGGLTDAKAGGAGRSDIWNYALVLGVEDIGGAGNLLGIVVGQQPRLTGGAATVDPTVGYHIEGFYRLAVSDRIDITPGVIWLPNPGHNKVNKEIFAATLRTRFRF